MQKWRSPFLTMIAVVALFASTLPSLAWACPMTGRIGALATVCNSYSRTTAAPMRCCSHGQAKCMMSCCKPIPQPSENEGRSSSTPPQLDRANALLTPPAVSFQSSLLTFALPSLPELASPSLLGGVAESLSSATLRPQRTPEAHAGRAPPAK